MDKLEIIFHIAVIIICSITFFPEIKTDLNKYLDIPIRILFKVIPMFCVAFSSFQLISSFL